ncbi:MAG: HEAT repeat domain-containing protein, partial [Candidatus Delongbacteria bacterium]|nr:HEAT repeat domain-containing protein [Candidatus Delongbacteria bacterium]
MRKQVLMLILVITGISQYIVSEEKITDTSIKQLADEFKSAKGITSQRAILSKLSETELKTEEDISSLADIIHQSNDDELKMEASSIFVTLSDNKKDVSKNYTKAYIELLESDEKMVRVAAINVLGKLNAKEAAPKLKRIVDDFSTTKYKILSVISKKKAFELIYEPGAATIALGEMKDLGSIPLLVDKFYDLDECCGIALASMGREGVKALIKLSKTDKAEEGKPSPIQALNYVHDASVKDILFEVLNDPKADVWLKSGVLRVLVMNLKDKTVLSELKKNYSSYESSLRWDII